MGDVLADPPDEDRVGPGGIDCGSRVAAVLPGIDDGHARRTFQQRPRLCGQQPHRDDYEAARALEAVTEPGTAVIGFTEDGGYWLLGLPADRDPVAVFDGVPMSTSLTGAAQHQRLVEIGYRVIELEILRDIDDYADLVAVAPLCMGRRLGTLMSGLSC